MRTERMNKKWKGKREHRTEDDGKGKKGKGQGKGKGNVTKKNKSHPQQNLRRPSKASQRDPSKGLGGSSGPSGAVHRSRSRSGSPRKDDHTVRRGERWAKALVL